MRVLIVNTQSVNHNNATGITLRSILQNFDKTELYELYMQPCLEAEDSFSMTSKQLPLSVCPLRRLANKFMKRGSDGSSVSTVAQKKNRPSLRARLIMMLDFEPIFVTPRLIREIKEFSPDCIYTLGNAIDTMKLAYKLSKRLDIPIVPHFMDNWSASHRYRPDVFPTHLKSTQKWLKKLYTRAKCGITISEKMAEEYEKRWKIKHYFLMNAVKVSDFRCEFNPEKAVKVFSYAGGLHLNRYKSLLEVAKTLEKVNQNKGTDLTLKIYTDSKSKSLYSDYFSDVKCVEFLPAVSHDDIMSIYNSSDSLVHIETFDEEQREFIKYSLSTKISEYLATGKPIFLYAPEDIFVNQYLKKNEVAYVASSPKELYDVIESLVDSTELADFSEKAVKLAYDRHDFDFCKKTFLEALRYTISDTDACEVKTT